jgi:hypothetical protein
MLDFGKSGLECRLEHRGWVVGAQLKPGAQARLLVIGCFVVNSMLRCPRRES